VRESVITKLERPAANRYRVVDEDGHVLAFANAVPGKGWGAFDKEGTAGRDDVP